MGLVRCGSHMGHGSGDVFIGFTTANSMPDSPAGGSSFLRVLPEPALDGLFRACAEATEEAVLDSLLSAEPARGLDGTLYHSLAEFL